MRSPTHRPQDLRCNANVYHLNGGASPNRAALMQATTETVNFTISPSLVRTQAASAPAQPRSPADATPAAGGAKAAAAAASAAVAPPESLRLDVAAATAAAAAAIAASAQLLKAQVSACVPGSRFMVAVRLQCLSAATAMIDSAPQAAGGAGQRVSFEGLGQELGLGATCISHRRSAAVRPQATEASGVHQGPGWGSGVQIGCRDASRAASQVHTRAVPRVARQQACTSCHGCLARPCGEHRAWRGLTTPDVVPDCWPRRRWGDAAVEPRGEESLNSRRYMACTAVGPAHMRP